jgi:hypoxanthine phosphoribosyltransferase
MKKLLFVFPFLFSICWGEMRTELLIGPEEIAYRLDEVARTINREYADQELTVVMIMKGAICVTADLIRRLHMPVTLEYVRASSYGQNGTSRGNLKIIGLDELNLTDKNVLLIDDIFDTGHTMTTLMAHVKDKNPKSLKSLVLLLKNTPRQITYVPEYVILPVEDRFVVGYGLDYKELYRGLPGIYCLHLE